MGCGLKSLAGILADEVPNQGSNPITLSCYPRSICRAPHRKGGGNPTLTLIKYAVPMNSTVPIDSVAALICLTHLFFRDGIKSLHGVVTVEVAHQGYPGALGSLVLGHDQANGADLSLVWQQGMSGQGTNVLSHDRRRGTHR